MYHLSNNNYREFHIHTSFYPQEAENKSIGLQEAVPSMDEVIADHIRLVLDRVHGRISGKGGAADILKMNPSTLYFRMKKLGINRGRK